VPTPPDVSPPISPETRRAGVRFFGPGLLTGAADDDPSAIGTYAQAGAQFGTGMLWVMLFTFPLMAAVQIISAHVGRVSGRGLAANLARLVPRWLLVPMLFTLFASNTINIGADLAAMGESAALLLPGRPIAYAFAFAIASVLLQAFLPYQRYVTLLKWLALSLLAYVVTALMVDVDWRQALWHTLVPQLLPDKQFAPTLVAVLGTTISPYLFFWQSAQEVEEQRASAEPPVREAPEDAPRQLGKVRVDTITGMGVSNGIGFFIMLTTAATLHLHGVREVQSAAEAAQALRPVAGRFAFALFTLGIVGTGLLAIPTLAGSAAYALAECFGWRRGLERKPLQAPRFYGVIALSALAGLGMTLMHVNPMRALVWASMINGAVSAPILVAMLLVARSPAVMGEVPIGRWALVAGWVTTVLMAVATVALFF
jgi:NRAMP (natural resistance-associated macrophage protein)-like metal ion transporter